MFPVEVFLDLLAGWCLWSLGHNLGHRWWHNEMRHGKQTFYAHGEREHHRIYDEHGQRAVQISEDPKELFISFPLPFVAAVALLLVAAYGRLAGWEHVPSFAISLYGFMILDHRLHIRFHKESKLNGILGWLQEMHQIHHATHNRNFFFASGLVWDLLFQTAVTRAETLQTRRLI
jgi:sterol desaturase/sphingolipid hydroxylase (fatty acid hydroxylase superfamily)